MTKEIEILKTLIAELPEGKRDYAASILDHIESETDKNRMQIAAMKSKNSKVKIADYKDLLEKSLHIIKAFGFSQVELNKYRRANIDFIVRHRYEMRSELTHSLFNLAHDTIEYYISMYESFPQTLNDLNKAYAKAKSTSINIYPKKHNKF